MNQTDHRDKQYQNRASLTNPKQIQNSLGFYLIMVYLGMKVADAAVKIHDSNQQYPIYSAMIAISKSRKKPQRIMRNKEYDTLAFPISYLESR